MTIYVEFSTIIIVSLMMMVAGLVIGVAINKPRL